MLSAANVVVLLVGAATFGMWFFLSLYLQQVLGYSPIKTGLAFLPMTLCIVVGSTFASRAVTRIGTEFFPQADESQFSAVYKAPVGTRVSVTEETAKKMEAAVVRALDAKKLFTAMITDSGMARRGFRVSSPRTAEVSNPM